MIRLAVAALAVAVFLTGCTVSTGSVSKTGQILSNRVLDFVKGTPAAPYERIGDVADLTENATQTNLLMTGEQLSLAQGAAQATGAEAKTVAFVIESEVRALDDGELERDVLGAIAGENTSIGIGQVLVSTAVEIERTAPEFFGPTTDPDNDEQRTALIKRLASDDWSALYAAQYLVMLAKRFPGDGPVDQAVRYTGANPATSSTRDADLYQKVADVLEHS